MVHHIKYGTERHKRILRGLKARKDFSERKMAEYRTRWNDAEDQYKAYLPTSELDEKKKQQRKQDGSMDFVNIEIPYTYAVLMTTTTYLSSVFLSRTPVFQFSARHGEPQNKVKSVEALIDYQTRVGEILADLYCWIHDMPKFGASIIGVYWDEDIRYISRIEEKQRTIAGVPIKGRTKKERVTEKIKTYEGNRTFNVRPHDFLWDPRVPLARMQDGEFCGRNVNLGWNDLVRGQQQDVYYNLKDVKRRMKAAARSQAEDRGGNEFEEPVQPGEGDELSLSMLDKDAVDFVPITELYVDLVPDEWEVGSSEHPEKWVFVIANDEVIISARPMGAYHDKFPFFVQEFGIGNDELIKRSLPEVVKPLNDTLSWLMNTHFYNVRKSLNDVRVVDPSRVVMKDLLNPLPGGLIRVKPSLYGTDVRHAVHQLDVRDSTQGHLRDAQSIETMIQRITGVADNIMGQMAPGGRKTATEVRTASGFSMNRLKTIGEYNSAKAWSQMGQVMLQNSQQYYSEEQQFRITGANQQGEEAFANVSPDEIAGFFDFVPVDGTLPVDRLAQANFWKELIQMVAKAPGVGEKFDIMGMIVHTMELLGEKNVNRFRIDVRPDEELMNKQQRGDSVPIGGTRGNSGSGRPSERTDSPAPGIGSELAQMVGDGGQG